jgi:ferredoxin-NADP reductase/Na+-translocating ferredoxin:NAD+ oxidoreductase RnfD subunit
MTFIDDILNRVTMYRLALYYLGALIAAALLFCMAGTLPYDPVALLFSTVLLIAACWLSNWVFAWAFMAPRNVESSFITALILALIIAPVAPTNAAGATFLIFAGVWAMGSKFIFAIGRKHIFNPAALAVALTALLVNQPAVWWVGGNLALLPFVLVGGLLLVRKLQRFDMVLSFGAAALITVALTSAAGDYAGAIVQTLLHSSFFFLAFVMLTEPLTAPPTRALRIIYAALVGFLFAPNIHVGSFYLTPELALLAGNVFAYAVSPKGRHLLTLKRVEEASSGVYDFIFASDRPFSWRPGQYLEWTLGHSWPDSRGNRRYFTVASAPGEREVRIGVKFYEPQSSFKRALAHMRPGQTLSASHLSGEFVLPRNKNKKLAFIAGGIGVTPFRSMVHDLLDKREARPIVMLYANRTLADVAYKDVFDRAQRELGLKTVYALSNERAAVPGMINGLIDESLIASQVPDYRERTFYISGPRAMVVAFRKTLTAMGVSRLNIKTDFFPGFA